MRKTHLALAADIRVSTADCQIGLPAIKESLIPGLGTLRLPRYIGWGRAKKMILGGQNIDGKEALRIGLVDHIVPNEDFFSHLDKTAREYLAVCSEGTRLSKLVTNQAFDMDYTTILQYYFDLQERAQYSPDAEEAKSAYRAKRTPHWQQLFRVKRRTIESKKSEWENHRFFCSYPLHTLNPGADLTE